MYVCTRLHMAAVLTKLYQRVLYHTGVCENNIPFTRAFALQHSGINCSPAPDLVFFKLVIRRGYYSPEECFFHRHRWLYYIILYYTISYYTILYYTILYYTILHDTILRRSFFFHRHRYPCICLRSPAARPRFEKKQHE